MSASKKKIESLQTEPSCKGTAITIAGKLKSRSIAKKFQALGSIRRFLNLRGTLSRSFPPPSGMSTATVQMTLAKELPALVFAGADAFGKSAVCFISPDAAWNWLAGAEGRAWLDSVEWWCFLAADFDANDPIS